MCNGDRAKGQRIAEERFLIFIAPLMVVALGYRWEGMENANTKVYLARRYHDIWFVGLRIIFPKPVVGESVVELARLESILAAIRDEGGELIVKDIQRATTLEKNIRGGDVVQFPSGDQEGHLVEAYTI